MTQADLRPSTSCPAARLARDAATLILQKENTEAVGGEVDRPLQDRLDALTDAASYVRADSALGAYFQTLLAAGEVDPDMPWIIESPGAARTARRVERLLRSAAAWWLVRTSEPATTLALASYYGPLSDVRQLS